MLILILVLMEAKEPPAPIYIKLEFDFYSSLTVPKLTTLPPQGAKIAVHDLRKIRLSY